MREDIHSDPNTRVGQVVFKRALNSIDVLVVAFGAMIGWGWVVSSGQWIQTGGVLGTVIGFAIGGAMIYFVGLTYAELTTAMPKCGGEHVFSYKAFGRAGAFICTWAIILSYIGVVCYEAVSLPTILQYVFPGYIKGYLYTVAGFDVYATWIAVGVFFAAVILGINVIGTKRAAILQTVLTVMIAGVGIILMASAAFTGDAANLSSQMFYGESAAGVLRNIIKVSLMTPFFFFGFDVIPQTAEEINIPLKRVGRLMVLSIVLAVLFYAMIVVSVGLVMSESEIGNSMTDTGLVTADAMKKAFGSESMSYILILGGMCGIVTSWNSFMIGGSRAIYSMAESQMLPRGFSKLHSKYNTPVNALCLVGLMSVIAPFFGRVMLVWIVDSANFACCLAYCMVAASFLVLRKKAPDMERPYKIKHHRVIGFTAVAMSGVMALMYVLPGTGFTLIKQEWIIVAGWACLGAIFYSLCGAKPDGFRPQRIIHK